VQLAKFYLSSFFVIGHAVAVDLLIEQLLILQDRDIKKLDIESQLHRIPVEITGLRNKIAEEQSRMDGELAAIKEIEVRRSDLDSQVQAAEQKVVKYKNQQLEVKKNDEYQALTAEIANMEAVIGGLEEDEIALMLTIDEKKANYAKLDSQLKERIQLFEKEIVNLGERETNLKSEKEDAISAVAAAAANVDPRYLDSYQKAKRRKMKPPFVVALEEQRCLGCHLKVSGDVESRARHFKEFGEPAHCDSCGRIVYWP